MVDKKMWHEEDDTIQKEIEADIETYLTYDLENFKGIYRKDNGIPAVSTLDNGRNCPKCAGYLGVKEVTKKGNVFLFCKSCGYQVFAEDIDNNNPEESKSDDLYRQIPSSLVLYYMNHQKEYRQKK